MKKDFSNERELQAYACKALRDVGCLVYKFSSPAKRGVPDLIIVPPNGKVIFVEMKHPNGRGKLSKLQVIEILKRKLARLPYIPENEMDEFAEHIFDRERESWLKEQGK